MERHRSGLLALFLWLLLGLIVSGGTGCAPSHVLKRQLDVSRDWTTITFAYNRQPFTLTSRVGGEHISTIQVVVFGSDKYLVELVFAPHPLIIRMDGEGIDVEEISRPGRTVGKVTVHAPTTLLNLRLSAHPYADYTLTIRPLIDQGEP